MESQAKYVLVGSFVIVAILMIIGALLWISGAGTGKNYSYYTVYFRRQSLEGLQKDSNVSMKGIKVGNVDNYRISSRNIEEVKVTLRLEKDTPVKLDTEAVIKRNLLTGLAMIDLVGGTQESQLLSERPEGEQFPVIPEGKSQLEVIADSIPALLEQTNGFVNRLNAILSEENLENFSVVMRNLRETTDALAVAGKKFDAAFVQFDKTLGEIGESSAAVTDFIKHNDQRFDALGNDLQLAVKQLNSTLQAVEKNGAEVGTALQRATQVFSQEVTSVSQNISEAAATFATTVEGFEDPQSLLRGPRKNSLGPGESLQR